MPKRAKKSQNDQPEKANYLSHRGLGFANPRISKIQAVKL